MKHQLSVMFLFAGLALAQTAPAPPKPVTPARAGDVVKVLNVKSDLASSVVFRLREMYPSGSGVEMTYDNGRTLVVRGPAAAVKLIEDTLKMIDIPPSAQAAVPNIEVTVQLLYASSKEDAKGTVTPDLQSTVTELHKVFPFTTYRVLDVLLQRGRDGHVMQDVGEVSGAKMTYDLSFTPNISASNAPRAIRLNNFTAILSVQSQAARMQIRTDIDVREGQKTVVGKMNVPGTEEAIFLVVSPKVIP